MQRERVCFYKLITAHCRVFKHLLVGIHCNVNLHNCSDDISKTKLDVFHKVGNFIASGFKSQFYA